MFHVVAFVATAATSNTGGVYAACYRRMDIDLSKCASSAGSFDMHVYDRTTKTWVRCTE